MNAKLNLLQPDATAGVTRLDLLEPLPETAGGKDFRAALDVMRNRSFIGSARYQEQQTRAVRENAHPDILEFEKRLVTRMRKQMVPLFCLWCWRDANAQNAAYVQGHSNARAGRSPHNYGLAVDIIHGVHGYKLPRKAWELLGHIGKEISVQSGIAITWGGDWRSPWDPAHWELREWKNLKNWKP